MTADRLPYDAVVFDVGGVLLDLDSVSAAHHRFVARLVDDFDAEIDEETALSRWRTAVGRHFRERDGTEFVAARDGYAKGVTAVVGEPVPREEWWPTFRAIAADSFRANPGGREAVAAFDRVADLHLGVLSDVDADEGTFILDELGVLSAFDAVTTSEDVGRTKPDPATFAAALDAAGLADEPDRAVMVGDRYEHDVAGAKAAGMDAVAYGPGADDGPAVDYRVNDLAALPAVLGFEAP